MNTSAETQDHGFATRIVAPGASVAQAEAWHRRYSRLYIGDEIVRHILRLRDDPTDSRAREVFSAARRRWAEQGGYIQTVSVDQVRGWYDSLGCLFAEAGPLDASGRIEAVADCVYLLPDDDWILPELSRRPSELFDPTAYEDIVADGPSATAVIDFLGVLPEWSDRKLAGDARFAGMEELRSRNGDLPAARQIRHVVGMSFAIHGVECLDEPSMIRLDELGEEPVVNRASLRAISVSRRCPARTMGVWSDVAPVPVEVHGRRYALHVHWFGHVRRVSSPPAEV